MDGVEVTRDASRMRWSARRDGTPQGTASLVERPDRRTFLVVRRAAPEVLAPLLDAVVRDAARPLHVTVDEAAAARIATLRDAGFVPVRRESDHLLDVASALAVLGDVQLPVGYRLVSVRDVAEQELRHLDDALRQDVPGTEGWTWDAADFRAETYDSDDLDPELYLVVVTEVTGAAVGLVRVWDRAALPRLGLVGVLADHRRQGLARAALQRVLRVLAARGVTHISMEIDDTNEASRGLLLPLGTQRIGGSIELLHPGPER